MGDTFDLETEVRELFAAKMKEFVTFCGEHWTMTAAEAETLTAPSSNPKEYARGYTDALQHGLEGALEHWLDETGYGV